MQRRELTTATGRGFLTARTGDALLGVAAIVVLFTASARFLVLGFVLAGLVGLVSVRRIWRGRFEFGPEHERFARRGVYLFSLAAIFFLFSFLSFQTFPSTSLGLDDNETVGLGTHRFQDLLPPVFLFSLALALETASGAAILIGTLGSWRNAAWAYAGLGVVGGIAIGVRGFRLVEGFRAASGDRVDDARLANFYYDEFLAGLLPWMAAALLISRVAVVVLLQHALEKIHEAEQDAQDTPAVNEPASSP